MSREKEDAARGERGVSINQTSEVINSSYNNSLSDPTALPTREADPDTSEHERIERFVPPDKESEETEYSTNRGYPRVGDDLSPRVFTNDHPPGTVAYLDAQRLIVVQARQRLNDLRSWKEAELRSSIIFVEDSLRSFREARLRVDLLDLEYRLAQLDFDIKRSGQDGTLTSRNQAAALKTQISDTRRDIAGLADWAPEREILR